MNEHNLTDILLFIFSAIIGGFIGGAFILFLERTSGTRGKFSAVRRSKAKVLQVPKS